MKLDNCSVWLSSSEFATEGEVCYLQLRWMLDDG